VAFSNLVKQYDTARQTGEALVAGFGFKYCVSPD
jgi:hypothetical protein